MPPALYQVIPQQRLEVPQHLRIAGGVKAVAAVVHVRTGELEAPGVPSDPPIPFHNRDAG